MKQPIKRQMHNEIAKGKPLKRSELEERGLRGNTLSEMAVRGRLVRVAHGVYAPTEGSTSEFFDYELASCAVTHGVFTLASALRLHELTDENPTRMTMAIPADRHGPKTELPIDYVFMKPQLLERDVEERMPNDTVFKVFSVERTIVECFKARNKIGISVAVSALGEAVRRNMIKPAMLWDCMKACRMTRIMTPYVESVL